MSPIPRISVEVHRGVSIQEELSAIHDQIAHCAHHNFLDRGAVDGHDLDDWLSAEAQLFEKPEVELRKDNHDVIAAIRLPELDPAGFRLHLTSREMLLTSTPDSAGRSILCFVRLEEEIDLEGIEAEYVGDTLTVVAAFAESSEALEVAEPVAEQVA